MLKNVAKVTPLEFTPTELPKMFSKPHACNIPTRLFRKDFEYFIQILVLGKTLEILILLSFVSSPLKQYNEKQPVLGGGLGMRALTCAIRNCTINQPQLCFTLSWNCINPCSWQSTEELVVQGAAVPALHGTGSALTLSHCSPIQ